MFLNGVPVVDERSAGCDSDWEFDRQESELSYTDCPYDREFKRVSYTRVSTHDKQSMTVTTTMN